MVTRSKPERSAPMARLAPLRRLMTKVSLNKVAVQVFGTASVIDAEHLRAADRSNAFRTLLIEFELFMLAQVQQTAACNALHDVQTRMCRWLLRMHDLG